MGYNVKDVLAYVRENDVKFLKLTFSDILGRHKNLSIVSSEVEKAFSEGVKIDETAIDGFSYCTYPLYLHPDASTIRLLPWRPQSGRAVSVFCSIKKPDGTPFEGDSREILKKAVERMYSSGFSCDVTTACEFYIFRLSDSGDPIFIPYDVAGYCDSAPLDKCENIRRDIILNLENMGINPLSSHHERGFGQNQIVFKPSVAIEAANNLVMYKATVRNICMRNGVYATFMPKPMENDYGSGLHIGLKLKNKADKTSADKKAVECFVEGILQRTKEIAAITNPTTNSYKRFESFEASRNIAWGEDNSPKVIKVDFSESYLELCFPDNCANPHILLALILQAGLDGIESKSELRAPFNPGTQTEQMPQALDVALKELSSSEFAKKHIANELIDNFIQIKKTESDFVRKTDNKQEAERKLYMNY